MMESISSEKIPLIQHTLDKVYLAIHYFEVDADVIFEIVSKELTPLKDAVAFFKKELL